MVPVESRLVGEAVLIAVIGALLFYLKIANFFPNNESTVGQVVLFMFLFMAVCFIGGYCSVRARLFTTRRLIKDKSP